MNIQIICCLSLMSVSLYGMESGDFATYLASPPIAQALARVNFEHDDINQADREKYKSLMIEGFKSAYEQLQFLMDKGLANRFFELKPAAYLPFVSNILESFKPLDNEDEYAQGSFVIGIAILVLMKGIAVQYFIPQDALDLIEKFKTEHPKKSDLCQVFENLLTIWED